MELSLIAAISSLDNKLEELDHNISLLKKERKNSSNDQINEKDLNAKIKILEDKIKELNDKISIDKKSNINEWKAAGGIAFRVRKGDITDAINGLKELGYE